MTAYKETSLWQKSFSAVNVRPVELEFRQRLAVAFEATRKNVGLIVNSISGDMRQLTVHDLSHLDSLWEIADTVAGPDYGLNPLEVFILGCTFLFHDAGLALVAYQNSEATIRNDSHWRDSVAIALRLRSGITATPHEIESAPQDIVQTATENTLRMRHAVQAAALPTCAFGGESRYLIEDVGLRDHFGFLIGRLSYSHWSDTSEVESEFNLKKGTLPGFPAEWTIDPLHIALLLRVSDACHIDSRRAPALLRALRAPKGLADLHWRAQRYLLTPHREGEQLLFTSAQPFSSADSASWWQAYELATVARDEIASANEALMTHRGNPFAARIVGGTQTPEAFAKRVPTEGWTPIETRMRVSNVTSLIRSLGGINLYGSDGTVPLRELLQNARDAVVARRLLEGRDDNWGEVVVRVGKDGNKTWIEVEDNGKGMSAKLLAGALLDFGATYWGSLLSKQECPGLAANSFSPSGKFGIGFFSVFLWGRRVTVRTRTSQDGRESTRVLEFADGPDSPPLLRKAASDELLNDPGTIVRVWLEVDLYGRGGPLSEGTLLGDRDTDERRKGKWTLPELLEWMCPAYDVNLSVEHDAPRIPVVRANDWLTLAPADLMRRLHLAYGAKHEAWAAAWDKIGVFERLETVYDDNYRPIGRAVLMSLRMTDEYNRPPLQKRLKQLDYAGPIPLPQLTVTDGGLRGSTMHGMAVCGILIGSPTEASRRDARAIGRRGGNVGKWAASQGRKLSTTPLPDWELAHLAGIIQSCGGIPESLPIARSRDRLLTREELLALNINCQAVRLFQEEWNTAQHMHMLAKLESDNDFGVSMSHMQSALIPFRDTKAEYRVSCLRWNWNLPPIGLA